MTTFNRFAQFVMDNWVGVIVACVVVAVVCIARRRSPWIIGLWLPSFAVASTYTLSVFIAILLEHVSPGGQSGLVGLWTIVQMGVALPLALLALLLLCVRPSSSAWRSRAAVVGYVLAGAMPLVFHTALLATRLPVTFLIKDPAGAPLPGVVFRVSATSPPNAVTDHHGRLTQPKERGMDLAGYIIADGYQKLSINVSTLGPESLFVSEVWLVGYESSLRSAGADHETYPAWPPPQIPIVMRPN